MSRTHRSSGVAGSGSGPALRPSAPRSWRSSVARSASRRCTACVPVPLGIALPWLSLAILPWAISSVSRLRLLMLIGVSAEVLRCPGNALPGPSVPGTARLPAETGEHVPDHLGLYLLNLQQVRPVLVDQQIELFADGAHFEFGFQVDLIVVFGAQAV